LDTARCRSYGIGVTRVVPLLLLLAGAAFNQAAADPAKDIDGAHDYGAFVRPPGYFITDFDEDNPGAYDFEVSRPVPSDLGRVETVHIAGHRLAIQYEAGRSTPPWSILQYQEYYEKLATGAGYQVEKTGAVGDVNETFHYSNNGHGAWVELAPGADGLVLTIVETIEPVAPAPVAAASAPSVPVAPRPAVNSDDDPLYVALIHDGRVTLPVAFLPNQPEVDADAQTVVDRVARMLTLHPEVTIQIEGHTDASGDPVADERLSAARARTIQAMLEEDGVERSRLESVGVGSRAPRASSQTEEGRDLNRRVQLVLKHGPAPAPAVAP
jgi:outer membrane protein OmpA-like peptidoglycan-associated protein